MCNVSHGAVTLSTGAASTDTHRETPIQRHTDRQTHIHTLTHIFTHIHTDPNRFITNTSTITDTDTETQTERLKIGATSNEMNFSTFVSFSLLGFTERQILTLATADVGSQRV